MESTEAAAFAGEDFGGRGRDETGKQVNLGGGEISDLIHAEKTGLGFVRVDHI